MSRASVTLLVAGVLAAGPAFGADLVVIESHVGVRPPGSDARLVTVVGALGDGALYGAPLADTIEVSLSRPAGEAIPAEEAAEIVTAADLAHRSYSAGEFEPAKARLGAILQRLEESPATLVNDLALRRVLQQTRLLLGDIYRRMGRAAEGTALVADAIRADARSEPSTMTFNPDLIAFFKSVRKELVRQPRGSIEVITRPTGAKVYLNDEFVGLSPVKVGDLYPGRHQVVVQRKESRGRVHELMVQGEERLAVDAEFDAALRSRPWVGLWFPSEAARSLREAEFAVRIGRALRVRRVVVVAAGEYRGRAALIGSMLDVETAGTVRVGIVALEPRPPDETMRALGGFLVGGDAGPGVIVAGKEPAAQEARPYRQWKWVAAGAALAAAGAGVLLVATDCSEKTPSGTCIRQRGTRVPGFVVLGIAGALGVSAGILFYYDSEEASAALKFEL